MAEKRLGLDEKRLKRLEELVAPFRVKPGRRVTLARDFDPAFKAGVKRKQALALHDEGIELLAEYQSRLAAHVGSAGRASGARRGG